MPSRADHHPCAGAIGLTRCGDMAIAVHSVAIGTLRHYHHIAAEGICVLVDKGALRYDLLDDLLDDLLGAPDQHVLPTCAYEPESLHPLPANGCGVDRVRTAAGSGAGGAECESLRRCRRRGAGHDIRYVG